MSNGSRPTNCNARVVEDFIVGELHGRLTWQGGRKHAQVSIELPSGTRLITQISRSPVDPHNLRNFVRQAVQRAERRGRA